MTVIVGIMLVVQPPFIFTANNSETQQNSNLTYNSSDLSGNSTLIQSHSNSTVSKEQGGQEKASKFTFEYLIGVIMGITFALAGNSQLIVVIDLMIRASILGKCLLILISRSEQSVEPILPYPVISGVPNSSRTLYLTGLINPI